MPTGYTSKLYDGKEQTADEFILECARAFGAYVLGRDTPIGADVPTHYEPSSYYAESVNKDQIRLTNLRGMSVKDRVKAADEAFAKLHARWIEDKAKVEERRTRYEEMLARVRQWEPPTSDHVGLKEFMVKQLEESIDFDCHTWPEEEPTKPSPHDWYKKELADAERSLEFSEQHYAEEIERTNGRNGWIKALHESLPSNR